MSRPWRWSLLAAASALTAQLGCAAAPLPRIAKGPRQPDGVTVDPPLETPWTRSSAKPSDKMVTLSAPVPVELSLRVVAELFAAITVESPDRLDAVLTRDFYFQAMGSSQGYRPPYYYHHRYGRYGEEEEVGYWRGRFQKGDYTALSGRLVYREDEVAIYRRGDAEPAELSRWVNTSQLGPNELVLHVKVRTPRVGADKLFGEDMLLWLRAEGDSFRVYKLAEDFQAY